MSDKATFTDKDLVFASEDTLMQRIDALTEHIRANRHDFKMEGIIFGHDMMCTKSNKVYMRFYNVSYFVPNIGICVVAVIIDPNTLEYSIRNEADYDSFSSVRDLGGRKKVVSRSDLDKQTRLYFDGMTAYTLYMHKYTRYTMLYPIMDKALQKWVFKSVADDTFENICTS